MKKVVVFGKGILGIKIIKWFLKRPEKYKILCVVPVMPHQKWVKDSLQEVTEMNNLLFIESGKIEDIPGVKEDDWNVDICQLVFYKSIIKDWFINKCHRLLNIHMSALPKYRGARGINWALKNNETEQGVTIHQLTPKLDQGPILSQMKFSIYPEFEEVIDVYNRALDYSYILFKHTMKYLDKIQLVEQDESQVTYYSSADFKDLGERLTFTKSESLKLAKQKKFFENL